MIDLLLAIVGLEFLDEGLFWSEVDDGIIPEETITAKHSYGEPGYECPKCGEVHGEDFFGPNGWCYNCINELIDRNDSWEIIEQGY
jgi:uncharacterized OB-fold protein